MVDKNDWRPRPTTEAKQLILPLPLPQRPDVMRLWADMCPRCHGVHITPASAQECFAQTERR